MKIVKSLSLILLMASFLLAVVKMTTEEIALHLLELGN